MASSAPPPSRSARKRPWYLVVALVASWVFGFSAMAVGFDAVAYYKADRPQASAFVPDVVTEEDQAAITQAAERYLAVRDAARPRELPLGLATMILGAAMWGMAAAAMAGRGGARTALVQMALAQGALLVVSHVLRPDVRAAEMDLAMAKSTAWAQEHEGRRPSAQELAMTTTMLRVGQPAILALRGLAYVLVIIALTRPRSRAFFEASQGPLSQR